MKKFNLFLFTLTITAVNLFGLSANPDFKQPIGQTYTPIVKVKSREWDTKQVCVEGILLIKNGNDEFVLQDNTDAILLFLPTDNLIDLNLQEGTHVQVTGTIDYSAASRNRTELYANKITVLPKS